MIKNRCMRETCKYLQATPDVVCNVLKIMVKQQQKEKKQGVPLWLGVKMTTINCKVSSLSMAGCDSLPSSFVVFIELKKC